MSVRVLSQVWDSFPKGGTQLLALLALADWSDDDGRCWPSIKSIAFKIRVQERQAQRAVNQLIKDGFVTILRNKFGGAPGSTRQYKIVISNLMGVTIDTPLIKTGVMVGIDGCHITPNTGVTDDTQTVREPSLTVRKKQKAKIIFLEDGSFKNIEEYLDVWRNAYPNVDINNELIKAGSWLISNPNRKKNDLPRFLNGWLARCAARSTGNNIMEGVS